MAAMDVNARLTLDASGFIGPLTNAQAEADATARRAIKAARDTASAQAVAAKFAGDAVSEQSIRILAAQRAQAQASRDFAQVQSLARKGYLNEQQGAATAAAALQRLTAAKLASARASEVEQHAQVSQRMAASAFVRGVDTGNVGIRSVENFLTTIPGVGKALQGIFPLIGGAAFVFMLGEMVMRLVEAKKEAEQLTRKLSDGFRDMHLATASSTDALRLHNDELQNEINKLEGKPKNNLAIALDENIIKLDEMAKKALAAQKSVRELIEQNKVGALGQILGQDSTARVAGSVTSYRQDMADLKYKMSEQGRSGDTAGLAQTKKDLAAKKDSYNQWLNTNIEGLSGKWKPLFGKAANEGANLAILRGERMNMRDDEGSDKAEARTGPLMGRKAQLEGSSKAGDEARKAAQLALKAMEEYVANWKLQAPISAKAIFDYWEVQKSTFAAGSDQFRIIVEKQATLATEGARKAAEAFTKHKQRDKEQDEEKARLPQNPLGRYQRDARDVTREGIRASYSDDRQAAASAARVADLQTQQAAGRGMTLIAAASEMAAIHTKEYAAALRDAEGQERLIRENNDLSALEKEKQLDSARRNIEQLKDGRRVQQLQDNYQINPPNTKISVGITDALDQLTREFTNAGRVISNIFGGALASTNGAIVQQLTTRHTRGEHIFGNAGSQIFKGATGSALEGAEGSILKGLGFGGSKPPKGTAGDPLHVIMAGLGAAGGAVGGVASKIAGGFGGSLGKFAHFFGIPGFASGVSNFGGGWAMVGEKGPELLNLPGGSSVIPNHQISAGGGGGHTIHIDARGASDPAQVRAQVMQGIAEALPTINRSAHAYSRDEMSRAPRSSGR